MTRAEKIGHAGDLLDPSDASISVHRAGGPVCVWPEVPEEALKQCVKCKTCKSTCALVHQVYAPLPGNVTDRVLLLFVCVNDSCCTTTSAFTALRCQLQPQSQPERPPSAPEARVSHSFGTVTWGEPATGAESRDSTGAAQAGAASDFSDLLSQMDELAVQPVAPSCPSHAPANTSRDSAAASATCSRLDGCLHSFGPELPGFMVNFEAVSTTHVASLEEKHIQMLLNEYQQETGADVSEDGAGSSGQELYEETDAMTQFVEDLSEVPYQCSRYGQQLRALWPGEGGLPDSGTCPSCGAPRSAELQVLAPMWHYMEEAATWYSAYVPASPALDTTIFQHKQWDWASVVVLTCENSCHVGDESWCVAQEEVVAFNLSKGSSLSTSAGTSAGKALNGAYVDGNSIEYGKEGTLSASNGLEE